MKEAPAIATFDDHASYTDAVRRPILVDLRNRVLRLDDRLRLTERCTPGQRIAYNIPGGRIFLEVKVQRAAIVLHLADGGCPDPKGIADDIPESHGWRQLKKRITILNAADLDAAIPFVEAAYRARP
jgi:predicted transport protein